ncbi:hypothetical protein CCMA1212_000757 [Trichoderma ghanense]|uniref:Uncharacterized protein n=1 Tax=Trichoderma ghanense TaxID=65468 RepID=A0ABY2HI92_9HYPO
MTQRNHVIAINIIVLFVVLAAISFGIYKLVHGARRELTVTSASTDRPSTSNILNFTQDSLIIIIMTTPPSASSGSSSCKSKSTSNEVPPEYLITSTSSLPPLPTTAFPFPPQPQSSSMPTTKLLDPYDNIPPWTPPQQRSPSQTTNQAGPSSDQQSSSAHLLHEQRLSTSLNILRHTQRTLRQRHDEALTHRAHLSDLIVRSAWDLFSQSPLGFMRHEMDILTDSSSSSTTITAILSDKSPVGIGSSGGNLSTRQESDAWMKKLDKLRHLRDDEEEIRHRLGKITRQMETASAMMRVGLAEQRAALARSDALVRGDRYRFQRGFVQLPTMASSCRKADGRGNGNNAGTKTAAPAPRSSFFGWPVPATTSSKGKQAAVGLEDEDSSGLDSPRECQNECCRHFTS